MKIYLQSTPYTTAAAGVVNILDCLVVPLPNKKKEELLLWKESILCPTRACSLFGLASALQKRGISCSLLIASEEYEFPDYRFYGYHKQDIEVAREMETYYIQRAKEDKIPIKYEQVTVNSITKLSTEYYLLVRVNAKAWRDEKRNTSNYVVITGIHASEVHIIDPAFGALSVSYALFEESLLTLKTKKHREIRVLRVKKGNSDLEEVV